MRIQVLFNETSVLVPCGDGRLTVKELVDKAIVRFKKVLNKHEGDIIEVRSLRMADTHAFVTMDDEVADVLEDKEVVILDFEFIPHYIRDTDDSTSDLPGNATMGTLPAYSSSVLSDGDHTPFSSGLHDSMLVPTLPNIEEDFGHSELNGDHQSQELHLDDVDPTTTPTSLHIGVGGASQDIDMVNQTWHSQNSGSQDPNSPHLPRKTDWRTSSDTGYATSKSQESYTQSQPKSQETFHHGGSDGLAFSSANHSGHTGPEGLDFSSTNRNGSGPDHEREYAHHHSPMDFDSPKGIGATPTSRASTGEHHYLDSRKEGGKVVSSLKTIPQQYSHHDDPASRFHRQNSQDTFSPSMPHPFPHPAMMGGMEYPPRGYDPYHGYGYPLPSLDEGGGAYDKQRYFDHYNKRRPMSMYGSTGDGHYHPAYGSTPTARHMMGHYGGRPGYLGDFYDPRAGRYVRPHDPHYPARLNRSFSHERIDGTPPTSLPSSLPGGLPRSRPHPAMGRPGMEEEFPGVQMEVFLSQPTTGYFSYEQHPPGYGGVPMMGLSPLYGDHRLGTNPSSGVSLSQPPVMLSHRPKAVAMSEMERMSHHLHHVGGVSSEKSSQGRASSVKSADSLDRRIDVTGLSAEEEFDLDPGEEEEGEGSPPKGRNPFQRDFRKSVFRDGSVYSQWMQRMYDYNIQQWPEDEDDNDVPQFEGDGGMGLMYPACPPAGGPGGQSGSGEDESGEEDDEYGTIHIVELQKCEEPLGIQLTHYTSPEGIDVGVYIAVMDQDGFAAKSGKLQVQDRILACNGCDFTKDMPNSRVEEIFSDMLHEPLLKMAISRGGFRGNLQGSRADEAQMGAEDGGVVSAAEEGGVVSVEGSGTSIDVPAVNEEAAKWVDSPLIRPTIKTMGPPSAPSQAPTLALTNTRQIGVRHTIQLQRGDRGFGFGLTSRDVKTDEKNQPVYVKTVTNGGAAYQDRRLRIGDRILDVNGVDVAGLSRPEVVQLLRESHDTVTLVISRHEVVEEQEKQELTRENGTAPLTVYKTVFDLEIPLHNSGPAGLGVTVYTKSMSLKDGGEMGVYIKSIVAGGAAAMDARLHKNDQVLSVNQHNLLGYSNQEAMEILKQAMSDQDTVHLVVARRTTPTSPSMASVGEEPEEEERQGAETEASHEVGIDVPAPPTANSYSRSVDGVASGSGLLAGGSGHNLLAGGSGHNLLATHSNISLQSQTSHQNLSAQTSLDLEPSRGSMRARAATLASSSPSKSGRGTGMDPNTSPRTKPLYRSQDFLGSGELYDRLEPLPSGHAPSSSITSSAAPIPPVLSHFSSLYDADAVGSYPQSSIDHREDIDIWGSSRHASLRTHPPHMSRDPGAAAMSRHVLSPSDIDYQILSPTGSGSSRENKLPLHHFHQRNSSYDSRSSSYPSDSSASITYTNVGVAADAPIRGSGRKDRNRPERGSGRSHAVGGVTASPEMNGYATLPRSSHHGDVGGASATPTVLNAASLENLRLSESESNMAFRRDNPGRISITKKTKKNPQTDLAHLRYDGASPLVEGEKTLVRTGSDSFLSAHNGMQDQEFIGALQIGPSLGLVKSSSLESLHNVMHHTIQRDIVDDGSDLRNRSTRGSFQRAVNHTFEEGSRDEEQVQRGVDVDFDLEKGHPSMPAMISFTKSPHTSKTKKKGFFKKVFKKKKKEKSSPESSRKSRGVSMNMEISPASLTTEERDQLMRHYTLQLRPHSHAATTNGSSGAAHAAPSDTNLTSLPSSVRHSMPMLDDYDSPGSPDEILLESMAKV